MRRDGHKVKRLASFNLLWQGIFMKKEANTGKQERLAQALRANLRRRKAQAAGEPSGDEAESGLPTRDSAFRN